MFAACSRRLLRYFKTKGEEITKSRNPLGSPLFSVRSLRFLGLLAIEVIEARLLFFKPSQNQGTGVFRDVLGRGGSDFLAIDHPDDVEEDMGGLQGPTLGNPIGVLEGDNDDRAVIGLFRHIEGAVVEGEELWIWEFLVARSFRGHADGVLAGVDGFRALVDGFGARLQIALDKGDIARFADPVATARELEVPFFGDIEHFVMAERMDEDEFIEHRDVVMDDHEAHAFLRKFAHPFDMEADPHEEKDDENGVRDEELGDLAWLLRRFVVHERVDHDDEEAIDRE